MASLFFPIWFGNFRWCANDSCYCKVNWDKSCAWWLFCDKSTACIKMRLELAYSYRKRLCAFIFVCRVNVLYVLYLRNYTIYLLKHKQFKFTKRARLFVNSLVKYFLWKYLHWHWLFICARWLFIFVPDIFVSLGAFKKFRSVNLLIYNGLFDKLKCVMCVSLPMANALSQSLFRSRPRSKVESSTMV